MFAILLYPLLLLSLIPNRERSFVALNGFAELTPGMLTIPMIKGQGADSAYFDLDKGEIGGKIVDTAGDVTIKDQKGNVCSRFIKSQIAPLNTFLEGNASGNASTGSFVGSASLAAVTKDLDGILKVSVNNAKVHIEGVKAAVSITVVDKRDPLTLTAQVYIVSAAGGSTLLGSVSTTLTPGPFGGNSRNNITIDEEIALSADSYHIRVVYQGYADNWTDVTSSVSISAGTMSYNYVKQVNETQLGRGLGIIFDTNNYLHYGHIAANSPLVFSYRGLSDLPGVLAGYGVMLDGSTTYYFGAKSKPAYAIRRVVQGVYEISHEIGHTDYNINVAIQTADDNWFGAWKEIKSLRTSTSATIKIADFSSRLTDKDFTITFTGDNK